MAESCKRQCVRSYESAEVSDGPVHDESPNVCVSAFIPRGPVMRETTTGPVTSWPLEMPVCMMSGSVCCTIVLDSIDVRVPEIKYLIEQKSGILQTEQDIFLDGHLQPMQDDCRLCHYADALYRKNRKIHLVRRSLPANELDRSTWRRLQKEFLKSKRGNLLDDSFMGRWMTLRRTL